VVAGLDHAGLSPTCSTAEFRTDSVSDYKRRHTAHGASGEWSAGVKMTSGRKAWLGKTRFQ